MLGKTIHDVTVGDRAELTCSITAELVKSFVALSGDHNPLHHDATFAASTPFGEPIAPGILTAALVSAVIGTELPGPGTVYLSQTLKFLRPVRLDDRITARVEIVEIQHGRHRLRLRTECLNASDEVVLVGEALVMPPKPTALGDRQTESTLTLERAA